MATSKDKKATPKSNDFHFRSVVRNDVVPMADDIDKNESHLPTPILFASLVVCIVLIVALPVFAVMYMDMNNATNAAIVEVRKMKELRLKLLLENQ
jgi:hypothetical protein